MTSGEGEANQDLDALEDMLTGPALEIGDRVRVVIGGRETGEVGVVTELNANGRVKIRTGDVSKTYDLDELRPTAEMGDGSEDVEQTHLHIGDIISINTASKGYVAAEGIFDDKCFVKGEPMPFDNCLFQIAIKNRVAGALDLEEYEANATAENEGRNSELGDQMLSTLRRVKRNEAELNASLQIEKAGDPIQFGMVIQLRHINSGKWLTANTGAVAITERESLECSLSAEVSKRCWFSIMPSSSLTSEGTKVENYVDLLLGESENGYLHISTMPVAKTSKVVSTSEVSTTFEVNVSMNPTVWKFQLYTAHYREPEQLSCGTVVQFYDPMIDGYLRALGRREREEVGDGGRDCLVLGSQTDNRSSSLWVIERGSMSQGGIVEHGDDLCFRHLASGKYMRLSKPRRGQCLSVSLVPDRLYEGTKFSMRPMSKVDLQDTIVREGNQIVLQSGMHWVGHEPPTPEMSVHRAKAATKASATCLLIKKADAGLCRDTRAMRASASVLETFVETLNDSVDEVVPLQSIEELVESAVQLLPDFLKAIELCDQLTSFVTHGRVEVRPAERMVEAKQVSFQPTPAESLLCAEEVASSGQKSSLLATCQADVDSPRQNLAREISIIDLLLDALEILTKLSESGAKKMGVSFVKGLKGGERGGGG
jgi:hypothetical protein